MADGVRLAFGTLTVFPVRVSAVDRRTAGRAMAFAPVVGLALGALGGAVLLGAAWWSDARLLGAALAVGLLAWLTRGLHLDGLADLADGLGSGKPAERALDIMKKSDIGPFGVITLVVTLLVQVAALTRAGPLALVVACAAGRLAITWACRPGVPSARPGGLGAMVAGSVRLAPALAVTAVVLLVAVPAGFPGVFAPVPGGIAWLSPESGAAGDAAAPPGSGPWAAAALAGPAAVAAGLAAAWWLRRRAVRRLGGITGDVLGALSETATTAALVVLAL
ncbi:adenosylcobinamide-GDP ribazoletransferase [Bailinhaonella thermotolerans]|uniref:Adenosylcobinamide-GDP ribazoletransferase n=1 Tax=Bailinhaonella thermotolerans TaxID=1070861 RepID=A0A3A4AT26_9ACTN|nr:adenosylcobinamide-GDP ribazoletransferase [Bailinhaonella thermotolerans]RJL31445.1 adenosylcobinamide-GDP ribazoletransferase [Bailinhaonella thermotolerans]